MSDSIFDRAASWLMRRLEGLIGLMLALMVVLVFGNVVLRYGFNSGIAVSEDVSQDQIPGIPLVLARQRGPAAVGAPSAARRK